MIDQAKDQEILEELHKDEDKEDFKTVLSKKKVNKWEMDEAMLGEV
ncbi:hypothetical protein KY348_07100 [Candidatus Woesearchaeota archaeon]|nr:hypothetical protein [Candidatus Woesearchaeota archaeon]